MTKLPYLPLFVESYDAATMHLSVAEDGAYVRLLRLTWRQPGCSLPQDHAWIARQIRLSPADYDLIARPVLDEFFTPFRGRLIQKRLSKEFEYVSKLVRERKESGKRGGISKAMKNKAESASKPSVLPVALPQHSTLYTSTVEIEGPPDLSTDTDLSGERVNNLKIHSLDTARAARIAAAREFE